MCLLPVKHPSQAAVQPPVVPRWAGRLLLGSVAALTVAAGWGQPAPDRSGVAPTAPTKPQELMERLSTVPEQLQGWRIGADPIVAEGPQLSTVLSRADAAAILSYQFQWAVRVTLLPGDLPPSAGDASHLTADVLKFADPLDAFGAFAQFRATGAVPLQILRRSYANGDQAVVWRGEFVVRMTPPAAGPTIRTAVLTAAETVAGLLPLPEQLPLMMRLMPEARLAPGTLRYHPRDLLGLGFAGDGLEGSYVEDDTRLRLVLVRTASDEAARHAYAAAATALAPGTQSIPLPLLGRQAQIVTSRRYGLTYLMHEARYLVLALGVHDRDTAEGLLRITATNIRILR
jgi:hypothetical protein